MAPPAHHLNLVFAALSDQNGYRVTLQNAIDHAELAQGEMSWPDRSEMETTFLAPLRAFLATPLTPEFQRLFGHRLAALLPVVVRDALTAQWLKHPSTTLLKLCLAEVSAARWFAALPWEFLCWEKERTAPHLPSGFLALHSQCHLVRQPLEARIVDPLSVHPIKVLIVSADPGTRDYPPLLHTEDEIIGIQKALAGQGGRVVVEVVRKATSEDVKAHLQEFAPHIVHYLGHGKERLTGGVLAFHQGAGVEEVSGTELGAWLKESITQLVVLSACHTASGGPSALSVGQAILAAGVPAVVAMQMPLRDSSGRAFSTALYRRLAEAGSIVEAVWEGRQAIQGFGPDWGVPTLSLAGGVGMLFEKPLSVPEASVPNNLPFEPDQDLIGREKELEEVSSLLTTAQFVTLTGTGGIGKTRLALEVALSLLKKYPDGVWLVKLAALTRNDLVPQAVAAAIGVQEQLRRPWMQTLIDYLKTKRTLLLLDSCEHLIEGCVHLADALLPYCPGVQLLATSRENLRVVRAVIYRVLSLSIPPLSWKPGRGELQKDVSASLLKYDSCRLLVARAKLHRPDFTLTVQNADAAALICRQLDGIPLALELAAASISALSLEQISSRLDDRFKVLTDGNRAVLPYQQTLRAVIDWSYELLDASEQRLFHRLSVFAEGWTLEMAEEVCADEALESAEILDLMARLVGKSWILFQETGGETRFRMLETLREYSWERLEAVGETAPLQAGHCNYFLRFAMEASPLLQGPDHVHWLNRLEAARANWQAALEWCALENAESPPGNSMEPYRARAENWMKLANALERFWYLRGPISEGREWLERALTVQGNAGDKCVALVLNSAGILASTQGDVVAAEDYHQRCLTLQRRSNDQSGIAMALNNLSLVALMQGDDAATRCYLEESLEIYRELQIPLGISATLLNLGVAASKQEDYRNAQRFYEESAILSKSLGHTLYLSQSIHNLADVMLRLNEVDKAQVYLQESVELGRDLGNTAHLIRALERLADIAMRQERYAAAVRWLSAATLAREQTGYSRGPTNVYDYERDQNIALSNMPLEAFSAAWRQGQEMTLETALAEALQK